MITFADLRGIYAGKRIFVVGKGPSLRNFVPFDRFKDEICIGVNNVYRYFPYCRYMVLWHAEIYKNDEEYLREQEDFLLLYSSFHSLPPGLPNAIDLPYSGDFPQDGATFGTLDHWRSNPHEVMFKTTFASAVKLAWWMGANHITLLGCDFSLKNGRTADDSILNVETVLKNYTVEEIFARQLLVFENIKKELAGDRVVLDRHMNLESLS